MTTTTRSTTQQQNHGQHTLSEQHESQNDNYTTSTSNAGSQRIGDENGSGQPGSQHKTTADGAVVPSTGNRSTPTDDTPFDAKHVLTPCGMILSTRSYAACHNFQIALSEHNLQLTPPPGKVSKTSSSSLPLHPLLQPQRLHRQLEDRFEERGQGVRPEVTFFSIMCILNLGH